LHCRPTGTVFFFDVDNTLLDNRSRGGRSEAVTLRTSGRRLRAALIGKSSEQLRTELGYADYLARCSGIASSGPARSETAGVSHFMVIIPLPNRLFPESLDAGVRAAIGAGGDPERWRCGFPAAPKVDRSGLYEIFEGQVLIYTIRNRDWTMWRARYRRRTT